MNYQYNFEKLEVWQNSRVFAVDIYKLTDTYPKSEMYGLCSQMKRAAISIVSNIAEGASRTSSKDQAHFYQMAFSSLTELLNQVIISVDLGFLNMRDYDELRLRVEMISNKLNGLRASALKRQKTGSKTNKLAQGETGSSTNKSAHGGTGS